MTSRKDTFKPNRDLLREMVSAHLKFEEEWTVGAQESRQQLPADFFFLGCPLQGGRG